MKDFKIYIWAASILLVAYVVAQYNKPSPVNWDRTLFYKHKIPYGTYILYNQLHQLFPGDSISNTNSNFYDLFHNKDVPASNYLVIAGQVNLSKYDYKQMMDYVRRGNSVFIGAFTFGQVLMDTLKLETGYEYSGKKVGINFSNSNLRRGNDYQFDLTLADAYFYKFDTVHAVVLGKNSNGNSNLLCYKFGKGSLYLCPNPLLFSNISLLDSAGADYAAKALSYLPAKAHIYWDEYQNSDISENVSPVRVFLSHPALQWAYYITLGSLLIFVFYEIKRRQRIIPVIEPLKNSTVEFVNVVGQVYYEQRNNLNIAQKKILYLLEHIRTRYFLKTNPLDMEFIDRLSQKTGIDQAFITKLVNHINHVSVQAQISDHELILLNNLTEEFYTKAG
ncbi:MAG: DUF4350 domain-containing protein [Bacteroidetes bacterium]|nr:DUF4350 domain-containing protein [Bacteroidota bacterium]